MRQKLTAGLLVVLLFLWAAGLFAFLPRVPAHLEVTCMAPAGVAFLLLVYFFFSGRIFHEGEAVRKRFTAMLATTLLVVLVCAWADLFALQGEIFSGLLEWMRLSIFIRDQAALTLAVAMGFVHPVLFTLCGLAILCLPSKVD